MLRDLDEVLMPGMTHWQSPRYFAYFATTGCEPGVLAELLIAGLNQVGILWRASPALQELEEVGDRLAQAAPGAPGGPSRPPGGHRLHRADHGAHRGSYGHAGSPRPRLLRAHALLDAEGGAAPRARGTHGASRRAARHAGGSARPHRRLRGGGHDRHDLLDRDRPGVRRSPTPARRPGSGCTSMRRTQARLRSAPSSDRTSPAGSGRTPSVSTRTSGCSRRWTAPSS